MPKKIKEKIKGILEIGIYQQARRPRQEVRKELHREGIDIEGMVKEARRITEETVEKRTNRQSTLSYTAQAKAVRFFYAKYFYFKLKSKKIYY